MLTTQTLVFWLVVVLMGMAVWRFLGKPVLSPAAVERRRRDRNHRRVVSRRHGPAIRLAVNVPRD